MTVQADLRRTRSETPKTGFLASRLTQDDRSPHMYQNGWYISFEFYDLMDFFVPKQNTSLQKLAHAIYGDFYVVKIENFQRKKMMFLIFLLKTLIVGTLGEAVLTSTHTLCFGSIIRKYVYLYKP